MAFLVNTFKRVRNNWKKSVFAAGVFSYGVNYLIEKYEISELMREYCVEAATYGEVTLRTTVPMKKVIVLLNPTSNKRSGQKSFEQYCEPILHLAGIAIEIVKTDSEGHARRYVEDLQQLPDAILIGGGDGTVSETITGLLRRQDNSNCPIGVLPIGRTNAFGRNLFFDSNSSSNLTEAKGLAKAAISVVRGKTDKKDVMKIEVLPDFGDVPGKPVYAMGSLHWGCFRDALLLRDQYWYTGPFRDYMAFLFNAFSSKLTWNCKAKILYTEPCTGCRNCYLKPNEINQMHSKRWWSKFIPKIRTASVQNTDPDYTKITNENCAKQTEININPTELFLITKNLNDKSLSNDNNEKPQLIVELGSNEKSGFDFIKESWKRLRTDKFEFNESFNVRTIEIIPEKVHTEENEIYFSIDNEAYEVKPVRISLIPKAVNLYVS